MSKRILFRLHGIHAKEQAEDCKEFIEGYFDLCNKRVKLSIVPYIWPIELDSPTPYDLFINTASDEVEHIAHAAGWSYITGIQQVKGLFNAASTTFHSHPCLVKEIEAMRMHFDTESK